MFIEPLAYMLDRTADGWNVTINGLPLSHPDSGTWPLSLDDKSGAAAHRFVQSRHPGIRYAPKDWNRPRKYRGAKPGAIRDTSSAGRLVMVTCNDGSRYSIPHVAGIVSPKCGDHVGAFERTNCYGSTYMADYNRDGSNLSPDQSAYLEVAYNAARVDLVPSLSVSASHVSPDYRLDGVAFAVISQGGTFGAYRVGGDADGGFYAIAPKFGCGKTAKTPADAIRSLLIDNGCQSIEVAGAAKPVLDHSGAITAEQDEALGHALAAVDYTGALRTVNPDGSESIVDAIAIENCATLDDAKAAALAMWEGVPSASEYIAVAPGELRPGMDWTRVSETIAAEMPRPGVLPIAAGDYRRRDDNGAVYLIISADVAGVTAQRQQIVQDEPRSRVTSWQSCGPAFAPEGWEWPTVQAETQSAAPPADWLAGVLRDAEKAERAFVNIYLADISEPSDSYPQRVWQAMTCADELAACRALDRLEVAGWTIANTQFLDPGKPLWTVWQVGAHAWILPDVPALLPAKLAPPSVSTVYTWSQVADLFCSGIEGGYSPWLRAIERLSGPDLPNYYADSDFWQDGRAQVLCKYDAPDDEEGMGRGRVVISGADLAKALGLMAERSARHFADFVTENSDAITGDVFLQYAIIGEVIYG